MEFSGQYLNYEEYNSLGGTLDIMPFNILEFECRKIIDTRTQGRLKNIETIPQEVKMCLFAIMNATQSYIMENKKANVSSENIDGYSVTYLTPLEIQQSIKTKSDEIEGIMFLYLMDVVVNSTPVLYLGA